MARYMVTDMSVRNSNSLSSCPTHLAIFCFCFCFPKNYHLRVRIWPPFTLFGCFKLVLHPTNPIMINNSHKYYYISPWGLEAKHFLLKLKPYHLQVSKKFLVLWGWLWFAFGSLLFFPLLLGPACACAHGHATEVCSVGNQNVRPNHDRNDIKMVIFSYFNLEDILQGKKKNWAGLSNLDWVTLVLYVELRLNMPVLRKYPIDSYECHHVPAMRQSHM